MHALSYAAGRRPLLQPLRPARPIAKAPWWNAAGTQLVRRRAALAPRSMLTFPSPGSGTQQQQQQQQQQRQPQQRQQQQGVSPRQQPAEQAAAPAHVPASSKFAEVAVAAARELKAAALAAAAASQSPVLVAFHVPACQLAFGEHLRVVGSCAQLGGWDPAAAPALEWTEGDNWTASVALPPGQHAFKLVIVRQDGSTCYWEDGADRTLRVPSLPGAIAAEASTAGEPLLHVTCGTFGNTAATGLTANRAQLQAAAEAAKVRISQLLQHKQQLATRLAALEAEVEQSEVCIAGMKEDTRRLVRSELQRLQQRGIVQAAVARVEGSATQAQQAQEAGPQQAQQAGPQQKRAAAPQKHPAAARRKQKRAAARAQLHSQYEQRLQQGGEVHAAPAEHAEVASAELAHEVKLAAAEAAIRAALEPAAVPAEEQALLRASLLGEEPPAQHPSVQHPPVQPEQAASWASRPAPEQPAAAEAEAEEADAAVTAAAAKVAAAPQPQLAEPAASKTLSAAPEQAPAASPLRAALMAAEAGLLRSSTSSDGCIAYSFAASPLQASGSQQPQLSAFHLAERHLVPQLPQEAVAGLWRAVAHMSLRQPFAAGHIVPEVWAATPAVAAAAEVAADVPAAAAMLQHAGSTAPVAQAQPVEAAVHSPCAESVALAAKLAELRAELAADAASRASGDAVPLSTPAAAAHAEQAAAEVEQAAVEAASDADAADEAAGAVPQAQQQGEQPGKRPVPAAGRVSLDSHSLPGLAICLAAHSLFTAAHTLWSVARTAVPAAGRRAADAAFWMAASAAAALPFLR